GYLRDASGCSRDNAAHHPHRTGLFSSPVLGGAEQNRPTGTNNLQSFLVAPRTSGALDRRGVLTPLFGVLTPLFGVRDLFGELVRQSGNVTNQFTPLRGPELIPEYCGFPAIFARIYAAGLECSRESAVPAGIG